LSALLDDYARLALYAWTRDSTQLATGSTVGDPGAERTATDTFVRAGAATDVAPDCGRTTTRTRTLRALPGRSVNGSTGTVVSVKGPKHRLRARVDSGKNGLVVVDLG